MAYKDPKREKEYRKEYYQQDPEKFKEHTQEWRKQNKDRVREYSKQYAEKLMREVLTYYGNGTLACVHCGFDDVRALSVDHIHGGGRQDRIDKGYGKGFYCWLRKNNYPEGFQTLCMNCQFIKVKTNNECA